MRNLRELRMAAAITRYHTARTLRHQSVGEHSFGVAQLVLYLAPNASQRLLSAALTHDLAELVTGDIPAPVKWDNPTMGAILTDLESKFNEKHGLRYQLSDEELLLLKWCDMAELVLWCIEELEMGNTYAAPLLNRGLDYLSGLGHPTEQAEELYYEFIKCR